ncbi:hypothetical protein BCR37DRAFT_147485 [Protomyces lactucae-debilis]|uniref:Uncharacterized protein n=1 Tax=Protomyces lactucae-debilis TaxID=2754530 RepID=A0A1Y2F0S9_PROLT|nr:uncharacterized protein BCR37DRAFT_147485 [Protomyces lactucae-debilis]ORY77317.1 hypothetical protein BCR37DRAFT_147485 [Protomyces lactucae-debilis]
MGRIISFAAPAYHSVSRAASPESSDEDDRVCSASYSSHTLSRPSVGLGKGCDEHYASGKVSLLSSSCLRRILTIQCKSAKSRPQKHVQFSDAPPAICEIPDWDRRPWLPSAEELAQQGQDEEELLASESTSDDTASDGDDSCASQQASPHCLNQEWTTDRAIPAGLVASHTSSLETTKPVLKEPALRRGSEGTGLSLTGKQSRRDSQVLHASLRTRRGSKSSDLTLEAANRWARRLSV